MACCSGPAILKIFIYVASHFLFARLAYKHVSRYLNSFCQYLPCCNFFTRQFYKFNCILERKKSGCMKTLIISSGFALNLVAFVLFKKSNSSRFFFVYSYKQLTNWTVNNLYFLFLWIFEATLKKTSNIQWKVSI